ncbi:hypothetical protein ABZ914_23330, partial [Spirillospora sp. NPDC046719]
MSVASRGVPASVAVALAAAASAPLLASGYDRPLPALGVVGAPPGHGGGVGWGGDRGERRVGAPAEPGGGPGGP